MKVFDALAHVTPHDGLNFVIALLGALVAFGAANRMNKETEVTIICAFVTVGVGLVAEAFSSLVAEVWQQAFDTLLLGGVVSLLIGTRRRTIWLRPELMPKISAAVCAITWLAFFLSI